MRPLVGISIFPDLDFFETCLPLFEQEKIEILEWSFDHCSYELRPQWFNLLLSDFSDAGRLIAHGVHYSAFTAKFTDTHRDWLLNWKEEQRHLKFQHISEHIGFKSQLNFSSGFPLPFDYMNINLDCFHEQITNLKSESDIPLGFELLALALSKEQVIAQAVFLKNLCVKYDLFIVLDLHNLYCQAYNFDLDINALINLYPIEYIKEIHISGGSLEQSEHCEKIVRRDTHNDAIPDVLFKVLTVWLPKFKHCKYIIFEQLPESLLDEQSKQSFINDFLKIKQIRDLSEINSNEQFFKFKDEVNLKYTQQNISISDEFYSEQNFLSMQFMIAENPNDIKKLKLNYFDCNNWSLEMIETAMLLSKKWNRSEN